MSVFLHFILPFTVMGKIDEPLNKNGIKQAKKVRDILSDTKIDLIICSPLLRAKQTAEIIRENKNIEIIYDERISERDYGEFEKLNIQEFDFPAYWDYYENHKYYNSENIRDFFNRVYNFLDELLSKYTNKNILLVTHGGVGISAMCYFNNNIPKESLINSSFNLSNCEIRKFEV